MLRYPDRRLQTPRARRLDRSLIKSSGDAIHHLGLRIRVVDLGSLTQMRNEGEMFWPGEFGTDEEESSSSL